ncbi:transcriptional coactivator p15/PC4 family protein [Paraburkholderia domus]|uniref:transcriptional coactivator p15/PC4 family protein n=1 Tax=Paraburkholderia domus TaxID=2793075 RepID=UPI001B1C71C8|nr:transcriptional coactivator p15/PC4 family protein [Paraburkholderia domus]CAE6835019.1 hypothetical protein R75483_06877 [Paraburkholderia domus]
MTTIVELRRSASERLRITLREYHGRTFIDMRVWFATGSGEYQASSKGITLRPEQVAEVCQGLMLAARAIDPVR